VRHGRPRQRRMYLRTTVNCYCPTRPPRDRLQPLHYCTRHVPISTCSRYKHQPLHLQHDHHHHQARRLKPRQIADASEHNRKTNGNRYSVTTTQGFRTLGQIADASEHNRKTNGNRYSVTTTQGFRTLGQIADASEHNRKTNGNRYSVTTTQGFRTLGQIAY
jgi:hypothetical protein